RHGCGRARPRLRPRRGGGPCPPAAHPDEPGVPPRGGDRARRRGAPRRARGRGRRRGRARVGSAVESLADVGLRERSARVAGVTGAQRGPELLLRRGLLLVAAAAALTGVLAGLGRVGVALGWGPRFVLEHGPLLVLGTFATVIALERAVAYA